MANGYGWARFLKCVIEKSYNFSFMITEFLMHTDDFMVLAEYNSAIEAEMAKNILACAGIRAHIDNEYMTTLYPGVVRARLIVWKSDYRQAKTLLRLHD